MNSTTTMSSYPKCNGEMVNGYVPDYSHDLPYYLEGDKFPEYKRLPPVNLTGQKISLPAGDYSLTIKEGKPLMERISFFPPEILPLNSETRKITIHQGETLNVHAGISPVDSQLRLEIQ